MSESFPSNEGIPEAIEQEARTYAKKRAWEAAKQRAREELRVLRPRLSEDSDEYKKELKKKSAEIFETINQHALYEDKVADLIQRTRE